MKQQQAMIRLMGEFSNPQALIDKLAKHPISKHFVEDSTFTDAIEEISKNPQKLQEYLQSDQRFLVMIEKVLEIDLGLPSQEEAMKQQEEMMKREEAARERRRAAKRAEKEKAKAAVEKEQAKLNELPQYQEKLKGNAAYKKRDFDTALQHYNKAIELEPDNCIFRLNKASVFIETGSYDECLAECDKAMEIALEKNESNEVKAKIYAKKGNCYFRQKRYEEALKEYDDSAIEKALPAVRLQIKNTKKAIERERELAYRDPAIAEAEKKKGGEFFKKQQYPEAKKCYDEAIKRDPENHIHYSNRAMVYLKLGAFSYSVKDADRCIEINPDFIKAYRTKGRAHVFLKEFHKAMKTYEEGLEKKPGDAELEHLKKTLIQRINAESQAMGGEDQEKAKEAMKDPEIRAILEDPEFQQILQQLSNPVAAQKYMADPVISGKIRKLMQAGIIKTAQA
mmetsp:Transcript_2167/g.3130  ORF Transcript_2167/g.3130 Transcript_2167/m.3130 type:complete len:452 (+) Transcript_2167:503-1858(+)